jgi:sulfur-oxidizing protein SoxA
MKKEHTNWSRALLRACRGWPLSAPAMAGPDEDNLVINGEIEMVTEDGRARPHGICRHDLFRLALPHRRNPGAADGRFRQPGDDLRRSGADLETVEGTEGKSCASCHEGPKAWPA